VNTPSKAFFHRLYGEDHRRASYKKKDFVDYTLMSALCGLVVWLSYGGDHPITVLGVLLSLWMAAAFPLRHGWELSRPLLLQRPAEAFHVFAYKLGNLKWMYFASLAVLLLENVFIELTPGLPHHTELVRTIALYIFYLQFAGITAYRTVILAAHLRKSRHVSEVLMQTVWKKRLEEQPNIVLEIVHAYFTGLLTHIILVAPWFLVITHAKFSVLLLPVTCAINLVLQARYLKVLNAWYYRDHWLSHHSETEFVYLHGSHHDAIPSGLIGVAGNGFLEGFTRHGLGAPTTFFNPLVSALVYGYEIKGDIDAHQYIPGVYPNADIERQKVAQHSMHHFGRLAPYGFGMSVEHGGISEEYLRKLKYLPDELKNSVRLEEQLDGFEWNNKMHANYLELVSRYEKSGAQAPEEASREPSSIATSHGVET
jgi:hypothetical protein